MSKPLGQFLNGATNLVMCLCLTIAILTLLEAPLTWQGIVLGTVLSTLVGYVFGDLVPVPPAADALAARLGLKGAAAYVVSTLVLAVVMGLVILTVSMLINLGFTDAYVATVRKLLLPVLGIAFVVLLVVRKPLFVLGLRLFGANAPAPAVAGQTA